jgi:hypothetical protein
MRAKTTSPQDQKLDLPAMNLIDREREAVLDQLAAQAQELNMGYGRISFLNNCKRDLQIPFGFSRNCRTRLATALLCEIKSFAIAMLFSAMVFVSASE